MSESEKRKSLVLEGDLVDAIEKLAEKEHRTFTNMAEVLLFEAVGARNLGSVPQTDPSVSSTSVARKAKSA